MREILFRAKAINRDSGYYRTTYKNGEWIYGYYCVFNGMIHCIYTGYAETDCGDIYPDYYEVDPETVGQYTGSTDKNGVKIFEGDIVRAITHSTDIYVEAVTFKNGAFWYKNWSWVKFGFKFEKAEVIGNIHDNPELLGEPMKPASKNVAQSGLAPATENFELLEG